MKKANLTPSQIKTLQFDIQITAKYNNTPKEISEKLKQIDTFLKLAFDLHIIDEYSDVTKIMRAVGGAGLEELNRQKTA